MAAEENVKALSTTNASRKIAVERRVRNEFSIFLNGSAE